MIAFVVVNFLRPAESLLCLEAIVEAGRGHDCRIYLVDNGVGQVGVDPTLQRWIEARPMVQHLTLDENIGFAGACNEAIARVLADPAFEAVALVNNDAIIAAGWLDAMLRRLDGGRRADMVASRMMAEDPAGGVDSLGIALYRSGFAANRKSLDEPLLGPCGGAALYSTRLLREARELNGFVFDPGFFCYAEDTDLALRARLLGFKAAYADDAVSRHVGSMTSGGGGSDFVMYHGLRNSFSVMHRNLPAGFLLRNFPWMLLALTGVLAKYAKRRRLRLLWQAYRDYLRRLPESRAARAALRRGSLLRWSALKGVVCPHMYQPEHVAAELRALFSSRHESGTAQR